MELVLEVHKEMSRLCVSLTETAIDVRLGAWGKAPAALEGCKQELVNLHFGVAFQYQNLSLVEAAVVRLLLGLGMKWVVVGLDGLGQDRWRPWVEEPILHLAVRVVQAEATLGSRS